MKRRTFMTAFGAFAAAPVNSSAVIAMPRIAASAQQSGKLYRVGVLYPGGLPPLNPAGREFRQALREAGFIEGQNLVFERRGAEGRYDRLPALASELVRLSVDVIVAISPRSVQAAKNATTTIPIAMYAVSDPENEAFVATLARPGGNVTGVANLPGSSDEDARDDPRASSKCQTIGAIHRWPESKTSRNSPNGGPVPRGGRGDGEQRCRVILRHTARYKGTSAGCSLVQRHCIIRLARRRAALAACIAASHPGLSLRSQRDRGRRTDELRRKHRPSELPVEQVSDIELVINVRRAEGPEPHHPAVAVAARGSGNRVSRRSVVIPGVLALLAVVVAGGCASNGLVTSTTSPTPQSECGRTPGTAGTWRPQISYCEY
jgi:hypothetical protein